MILFSECLYRVIPVAKKLGISLLLCQSPDVLGSVPGLVCPASAYSKF